MSRNLPYRSASSIMRTSSAIGPSVGLSVWSVKGYNPAMSPQDRTLAREALLKQKLTIEQVTDLSKKADETGRSFAELAVALGLLSQEDVSALLGAGPPPIQALFPRLLIATLGILVALVIVGLLHLARQHRKDVELADESMRSRAEAERQAREVSVDRQRELLEKRRAEANEAIEKARAIMKSAEARPKESVSDPQLYVQLVEATKGFSRWLEDHPDDASVLIERSREIGRAH